MAAATPVAGTPPTPVTCTSIDCPDPTAGHDGRLSRRPLPGHGEGWGCPGVDVERHQAARARDVDVGRRVGDPSENRIGGLPRADMGSELLAPDAAQSALVQQIALARLP